ncbi:hypothetical protein ACLK1T_13570 [Escherichia coli]
MASGSSLDRLLPDSAFTDNLMMLWLAPVCWWDWRELARVIC